MTVKAILSLESRKNHQKKKETKDHQVKKLASSFFQVNGSHHSLTSLAFVPFYQERFRSVNLKIGAIYQMNYFYNIY